MFIHGDLQVDHVDEITGVIDWSAELGSPRTVRIASGAAQFVREPWSGCVGTRPDCSKRSGFATAGWQRVLPHPIPGRRLIARIRGVDSFGYSPRRRADELVMQ